MLTDKCMYIFINNTQKYESADYNQWLKRLDTQRTNQSKLTKNPQSYDPMLNGVGGIKYLWEEEGKK